MNRILRTLLIAALLVSLCAYASAETITYGSEHKTPIIIDRPGEDVTIKLNGVSISGSDSPAIKVNTANSLTIILVDGTYNYLYGDDSYSAIDNRQIPMTITCESAGEGHTCDNSCGKLYARGGYRSAGIGGSESRSSDAANITIAGGNITAGSSGYGAGIGGADLFGDASNITISGGNVTASGGTYGGVGIGSGSSADASNIVISGGKVTATGVGRHAGIGCGPNGSVSGITISGGSIEATGSNGGAGMGAGSEGSAENIVIAPKGVTGIEAKAGADASSATALEGSPFTSGSTDITEQVADQAFFQTRAATPETGDGANFVLWTSMLLLGAAALVLMKKRAHA